MQYNVYYSSGCAGRMLALGMLYAKYNTPVTQEIIKNNFDIKSKHRGWQESEVPPAFINFNDDFTIQIINENSDVTIYTPGVNVVSYTDIKTQYYISEFKHTLWFKEEGWTIEKDVAANIVNIYNGIKDPSWPDITTSHDFINLATRIKSEMEIHCSHHLDNWNDLLDFRIYSGAQTLGKMKVFEPVKYMVDNCDHAFNLKEIVQSEFRCVTNALNLEYHKGLVDYVNMWVNLHPKNIQDMFYEDI